MSDDIYHKMVNCPEIQGQWEPKVGNRTNKGVLVELNNKVANGYCVYKTVRFHYCRSELIYHPTQEDLEGMLPHKEGRYYSLGWGADEQGVVRYKFNIYQWQKLQETFYGTARETLAQGVMHGHGKRWDGEGWVE